MNKIVKILVALSISGSLYAKDIKVYATVDGEKITSEDVSMLLRNQKVTFETLPKELQKNLIDKLVERKILAINANNSGITKTKEYKETLEKALKALKEDLSLQIWYKKLIDSIKINEKEIKNFYNQNKNMFIKPDRLKARHILVKTQQKAQEIIKKLKNSKNLEKEFIKLAKSDSIGPSGKNGGELGWFEPKQMVKSFSNAAKKLQPKTITLTPVKTQFGYHIIYLEDKQDAVTIPFEEIKDKIKKQLISQKIDEKIKEIVKNTKQKLNVKYNF